MFTWKKKTAIISVCTVALIVVIIASAFTFGKQLPQAQQEDNYKQQAQKIFKQAFAEIERIRNVTLPAVELEVITKQWAIDTWGTGSANQDLTNILREEKVYKGLFMMPENASLYQANVDWVGYWGAVTWNGRIYVVEENFDPFKMPEAEATFVHELTHIMQGQLPSPYIASTFDSDKARAALSEGDASYMGDYFISITKSQNVSGMASVNQVPIFLLGNRGFNSPQPSLPQTISYLNYFPYDYGKAFIKTLYIDGGWALVNSAYPNPPNSTEQILHPNKYYEQENPQKVNPADLTEKDWTKISDNTYGEYFTRVMLNNWLPPNDSQIAAAGWAGDKLSYYERGNGEYLFTWKLQWDTSHDACQFFVTFRDMMNATGATKEDACLWSVNGGRYTSIEWDQASNSTIIAVSSSQPSVQSILRYS